MTYIENVFLCMLAPLLVAGICMGRRQLKTFAFCFAGMGACLFSAYLNTFLAIWYQANSFTATVEIAPVVEEVVKLLPLLFYLLVFEPKPARIRIAALIVAVSFATFENICYLSQNGAEAFSFILFRGFGTGAMHVVCGAMMGEGLSYKQHLRTSDPQDCEIPQQQLFCRQSRIRRALCSLDVTLRQYPKAQLGSS